MNQPPMQREPANLTMRVAVLLVLLVGLVTGCARRSPPQVTAADAERGNIELAELQSGRKLLLRKCAGCHKTPMPNDHTPAEWPKMIAEMAGRAKLDAMQTRLIEKYLVVMSESQR
jgi:cytochrome c5